MILANVAGSVLRTVVRSNAKGNPLTLTNCARTPLRVVRYSRDARTLVAAMPVSSLRSTRPRANDETTRNGARYVCTSNALTKAKSAKERKLRDTDWRELAEVFDVDELMANFREPVENLKNDFVRQVSVRSSIGAIEELPVNYENYEHQLQELVQISRKPNLVVLHAHVHPTAIPMIVETLRSSRMNLNPQIEKTTIYIPIPKITKEHRENMSRTAKQLFVKCRDKLAAIRTRYFEELEEKSLSRSTTARLRTFIDAIRLERVDEAQRLLDLKQSEVLLGTKPRK